MAAKRKTKARKGKVTVLQVNNIPWDLYDRIGGKASFLGLGRDEWVREVMERETEAGKQLQQEWKKERERPLGTSIQNKEPLG
jgi:hypothetical protein